MSTMEDPLPATDANDLLQDSLGDGICRPSNSPSFYDSSRFTCEKSTSETFKNPEAKFYGAFSSYRRKLDYKYHVHYKKERQWLHDSIIEDVCTVVERSRDADPSLWTNTPLFYSIH